MKTMKGYHITSTANIGEIAKNGLVPKIANNSMESEYYKRVYFGTEKNNLFVGLLKNRLKYFNKEDAFKILKDFFVQDSVLLELNLSDKNVYIHENMDPKNSHTKPMFGVDKKNIGVVTIDDLANIKSYLEYMAETIDDLPKEFNEFIEYLNQENNLDISLKNNSLQTKNIQQYYDENEQEIEYKSFNLYKNNLFKLLENDDIDVPLYLMAIIDSSKYLKYNDENIKQSLSIISEKLKNNFENNNSNLYKLICKISDDCLVNEKQYHPMTTEYINTISRFCVNAEIVEKTGKVDDKCIMGGKISYLNFEKDKLKEIYNIPTTDEKELYNIIEDNYKYIIDVRGENFNLENENLLEKIKDKDLESIFINSYGFGKSLNSILEFPYYKNQSNKYMDNNVEKIYININKNIVDSNIGLDNNENFMDLLSKINEVCIVEKKFYTPELSECIERVLKSQVYININKNSKKKMENNDYYSLDALLEYKNHFDNEIIELVKTNHDKEIIPIINKNFEQIYNMKEYLSGGSLEYFKNEKVSFRESMKNLINSNSEDYMNDNNANKIKNVLKEYK